MLFFRPSYQERKELGMVGKKNKPKGKQM